jgi:hypothetical protein
MPRSSSTKLEKQTAGKSSNQITLQQPRHDWPAELGVGVAKRYVVKAGDRDCIASSPPPPLPLPIDVDTHNSGSTGGRRTG